MEFDAVLLARLVISTFPYLVPPTLTIWQTAAVRASQIFLLLGTIALLPIIFGYSCSCTGCSAARYAKAKGIIEMATAGAERSTGHAMRFICSPSYVRRRLVAA